jgi:hypothetical protein
MESIDKTDVLRSIVRILQDENTKFASVAKEAVHKRESTLEVIKQECGRVIGTLEAKKTSEIQKADDEKKSVLSSIQTALTRMRVIADELATSLNSADCGILIRWNEDFYDKGFGGFVLSLNEQAKTIQIPVPIRSYSANTISVMEIEQSLQYVAFSAKRAKEAIERFAAWKKRRDALMLAALVGGALLVLVLAIVLAALGIVK